MPISCPVSLKPITEAEFRELDYGVTRQVFDSHNEFGRFCDEVIYKNDVARRLRAHGVTEVIRELPVEVTHGTFAKTYFVDLLVGLSSVYEFKMATALVGEHRKQTLHYLLLLGCQRGKIFNLRPASVEHVFVATRLTPELRREFRIDAARWRKTGPQSVLLKGVVAELLSDWGAFLDLQLYREALIHFLGGEAQVVQPVDIRTDGCVLGSQRMNLLDADTAFSLTALTKLEEQTRCETHLHRLLSHTRLRAMQWLNFSHHDIQFVTLFP